MKIRDTWLVPLLELIPYALKNPNGKRFPTSIRVPLKRSKYQSNLNVLITQITILRGTYPGLFLKSDEKEIEKLFEAEEKGGL